MFDFLKKLNELGAKTYFVGGCVRDAILGIESKDIDIEVYNIEQERLEEVLKAYGQVDFVGKQFGIFKMKVDGVDLDISLPRKEIKTGIRHTDFEITVDPFISTKEACLRRDFTINSILKDTQTGEVIDHFGGIEDLKNGVIRHTNERAFIEDPLRVLRACQFASRFNFVIDPETVRLMGDMDLSYISKERVEMEFRKAFEKGNPERFLRMLYGCSSFIEYPYRTIEFIPKNPCNSDVLIPLLYKPGVITDSRLHSRLYELLANLNNNEEDLAFTAYLLSKEKDLRSLFLEAIEILYDKEFSESVLEVYEKAKENFISAEELMEKGFFGKKLGVELNKDKVYKIIETAQKFMLIQEI